MHISKNSIALLLCLFSSLAIAQPSATNPTNPAGTVGAGDLIDVSVADLLGPQIVTTLQMRVDAAGKVGVPKAGVIEVGGLTTDVAASRIAAGFERAQVIRTPIVTVAIIETADKATVQPGPLAIGDKLRVVVADLVSPATLTTIHAQVGRDGTITLPQVGAVKVAAASETDAAAAVATALREKQIVADAIVVVLRTGVAK